MRFIALIKGDDTSEAGMLPERVLTETGRYTRELAKTGAIFGAEVLHPSAKGARVRFSDGQTSVIDGPFRQPQELLGGYWHLEAESLNEAIELVKHMLDAETEKGEVEIRQVLEIEDLAPRFSWME